MFSYLRRGPGFYRRVGGLAVPIILQNLITSTLAMPTPSWWACWARYLWRPSPWPISPCLSCSCSSLAYRAGSAVLISQYWGRQDGSPSTGWLAWPVGGQSGVYHLCPGAAAHPRALFEPVRQPAGGHPAGSRLRPDHRPVLCAQRRHPSLCSRLAQHGAAPASVCTFWLPPWAPTPF